LQAETLQFDNDLFVLIDQIMTHLERNGPATSIFV